MTRNATLLLFLILLVRLVRVRTTVVPQEQVAEQNLAHLTPAVLQTTRHECHENGVIAAWCDPHHLLAHHESLLHASSQSHNKKRAALDCSIHPTLNLYMCRCDDDPAACPLECVQGSELVSKQAHSIQCRGLPADEPNYILTSSTKSKSKTKSSTANNNDKVDSMSDPEHCQNNALVAQWCGASSVNNNDNKNDNNDNHCLLLPPLDEYMCTCPHHPANCPQECVGGTAPRDKTHHSIRCRGIPVDQPNYVLT